MMPSPWVAAYRERLDPAPPAAEKPLSEDAWPHALGDPARFAEWLSLFETEMADRPTSAVVEEWVPRLVPGTVGAAAHGLIRTAHGLRALTMVDTPARRLEVATGLAHWASQYQELPGPPLLIGHQGVPEALADLPYLPEETPEEFLITRRVAHVADIADEFEQAVASLGWSMVTLSACSTPSPWGSPGLSAQRRRQSHSAHPHHHGSAGSGVGAAASG